VSNIAVAESPKYWAFISYSHKDAAFGRRLHRRLESYALPRRIVGRATSQGVAPRRLAPIFRDREEFSAANDLSTEVRAALQASRSLIVVCSPAAVASPWVAREVETFRALHPDRPVLAAIREGEPPACFPDVLQRIGPDGAAVEPLAADFRKGRDGAELGLLKLVAGILGIGLDELVQRDAQRRTQRVTAVTAAALVGMLAMGLLTIFALNARSEAERQRTEAEGLVEFMLTDLRTTLKGVGRLDAMAAVNERALRYYSDQDLDTLPPESLERRARILHAIGEDDETRGDHDAALAKFQEARRTTSALLAAAPHNPERIFDQAQSEFWIGFVDYERGRPKDARPAFREYKRYADELVAISPNNPVYRREAAFADGSLCSLDLDVPLNPASAMKTCGAALTQMEEAARLHDTKDLEIAVINRHAWIADAYRANGEPLRARTERLLEERLLDAQMAQDPNNMHLQEIWVATQRALALLDLDAGQKTTARQRLLRVLDKLDAMTKFEPANKAWSQLRAQVQLEENSANEIWRKE
jgi:tetratricopeptide (TPR) repeat protein